MMHSKRWLAVVTVGMACAWPAAGGALDDCERPAERERFRCDPQWALKMIGWPAARDQLLAAHLGEPGAGVVIAQLDSGVAIDARHSGTPEHPALADAYRAHHIRWTDERGRVLPVTFMHGGACEAGTPGGCAPADDRARVPPLDPVPHYALEIANLFPIRMPGHGTKTASVIIADKWSPRGSDKALQGAAAAATLVPLRVTTGSILTEGRTTTMTWGIQAAALWEEPRVDVMSISFGRRSPEPALEEALLLAEERGIIVVAAAGQLPFGSGGPVRYPAQYESVVAVTGVTEDARPWGRAGLLGLGGAGKGSGNDVAAPAVDVWRAGWSDDAATIPDIDWGAGTSFATPLVAAAAAMWIQRHGGREELLEFYRSPGMIPMAFHLALETAGVRGTSAMCDLAEGRVSAQPEAWPNRARVCAQAGKPWNRRMGHGILAIDTLLAAPLPQPRDVCRALYDRRGVAAWDRLCPQASAGRDEALVAYPPRSRQPQPLTLALGTSIIKPFGGGAGFGPAVSATVIFGQHERIAPKGFMVGVKWSGAQVLTGVGYAIGGEYNPYRDSTTRSRNSLIFGYGPAYAAAIKVGYMRARGHDHLGGDLQVAIMKLKASVGPYWRLGNTSGQRRVTWVVDVGVGF